MSTYLLAGVAGTPFNVRFYYDDGIFHVSQIEIVNFCRGKCYNPILKSQGKTHPICFFYVSCTGQIPIHLKRSPPITHNTKQL